MQRRRRNCLNILDQDSDLALEVLRSSVSSSARGMRHGYDGLPEPHLSKHKPVNYS